MAVKGSASARVLKAERELRERVEELGRQLRQSIDDLRIYPGNLERAVETALALARQPALVPAGNGSAGFFRLPALSGTWAQALAGIEDPLTGNPRLITFDPSRADDQDLVLAHLGSPPLVMSTRLLRAARIANNPARRSS